MAKGNRHFIEESFPVREVSKESAREKNIRHGHISTLHIWWARRPLASWCFDEARKLSQCCGIELAEEWDKNGFVKREREFIKVLGPQDRKSEDLRDSIELIDVLHNTLLLWEKGKRDDILTLLKETGYGVSEAFYRVAQAISETLSNESKEKKLLDGFLVGKERVRDEIKQQGTRLF